MMQGKDFGRGVHLGMSVKESENVARERSVFGLPGRIKRSRRARAWHRLLNSERSTEISPFEDD